MAVVEYKTRLQKPRRGVCSTWLSRLKVAERPVVPLWVKKGTIVFPKEAVTPVIMVGPGTVMTKHFCVYDMYELVISIMSRNKKKVIFLVPVSEKMNNV